MSKIIAVGTTEGFASAPTCTTGPEVEIEFDPAKSAKNHVDRGLPFERVAELEWVDAYIYADFGATTARSA